MTPDKPNKPKRATQATKSGPGRRRPSSSGQDLETRLRDIDEALRANVAALSDVITHSVFLTRERAQEIVDETVRRGRITRDDANELLSSLVTRGRRGGEDVAGELEQLANRWATQIEDAASEAHRRAIDARKVVESTAEKVGKTGPADTILRTARQARRATGIGGPPPSKPFPIIGYEELNAREAIASVQGLKSDQLRKVREYERRHANRKTVLSAIDKLL
jgi:polyhydroxyalkanoate synthesis regulator phasin